MLPNWEAGFSIHNKLIDEQHKKLFDLAHRAYSLGDQHTSREKIREILSEFFEYMKFHFNDEEKYMEEIEFPYIEEHKRLHRYIVKELAATIQSIHNVNDMKEKLKIVAQEWLLKHILQEDMLIEKFRMAQALEQEKQKRTEAQKTTEVQEKVEKKEEPKPKVEEKYLYVCGCKGKVHSLSLKNHKIIQKKPGNFKCKKCHQPIRLLS